jgi:seryl-tRNA synthetase
MSRKSLIKRDLGYMWLELADSIYFAYMVICFGMSCGYRRWFSKAVQGQVPPSYPFKYWAANAAKIEDTIRKRKITMANIEKVNSLRAQLVALERKAEESRRERNRASISFFQGKHIEKNETEESIEATGAEALSVLEGKIQTLTDELHREAALIPNDIDPNSPVGEENQELLHLGLYPKADRNAPLLDHYDLGLKAGIFDLASGSKTTGSGFLYWTREGANLELALVQYAFKKAVSHGFEPILTPDLVQSHFVERCGFHPRRSALVTNESYPIYHVKRYNDSASSEQDDMALVGTAEVALASKHANDRLQASLSQTPIQYVGLSHCFRSESAKERRGIYRLHQFTKVELFVICSPDLSEICFDRIISLQRDILQELSLPFRVLNMASSELGASAYRKYDLEIWMPGRRSWGEVCSTSNCTDYQTRRLNIKYQQAGRNSKWEFPHSLNGTALAVPRIVIGLLEHGQRDEYIELPKCLSPWWWGKTISDPLDNSLIPIIPLKIDRP